MKTINGPFETMVVIHHSNGTMDGKATVGFRFRYDDGRTFDSQSFWADDMAGWEAYSKGMTADQGWSFMGECTNGCGIWVRPRSTPGPAGRTPPAWPVPVNPSD